MTKTASETVAEVQKTEEKPGEREMHGIKCSKCGKEDKVPFKPESGREVLCKDCHSEKIQNARRKRFNRRRFNKRMYDAKCSQCRNECRTPFDPKISDKKVICKECFIKNKN